MELLVATHDASMEHDAGAGHPERPERITAVVAGLRNAGVPVIDVSPPLAPVDLLENVHSPRYVAELKRFCAAGGGALDLDTHAGPKSWDAALRAAAAGPMLVDLLAAGTGDLGFVAMRPPGHHAVSHRAMGFCLFNNVAVTARHLAVGGARVAIVDWDVHHGNGTQDIFYDDPAVLYLSVHQEAIYPGSGSFEEVGSGDGVGTTLNVPAPAGTGGLFHRAVISDVFAPVIEQFEPDWLLVSAGYDAHKSDPLAGLRLVAADYATMARCLGEVVPANRTTVFLEGGYDLDALEASAASTVKGWLRPTLEIAGESEGCDPEGYLRHAADIAARYWNLD